MPLEVNLSALSPFWRYAIMEAAVLLFLALVAIRPPNILVQSLLRFERAFDALARKRKLSVLVVILFVLLGRLAIWPVMKLPIPTVHDEFSYLLAGDTFASGRLTNPPHPMWQHFESFHINVQPTYQSMYPVAQGLVLAFGQAAFHQPWFGVLLSAAIMCGAFVWMLQGWLPPRWALLGGFVSAIQIGIFSYWMNSYWGGAPAAIGGALVLGAWARLRRTPTVKQALVLAFGLAVLANSRPYEGMLLAIPVAITLIVELFFSKNAPPATVVTKRVALPVITVLAVTVAAMGYYFHAVTGKATLIPFTLNRNTYAAAKIFIWQAAAPFPQYRHAEMRHFYLAWEYALYLQARTLSGWLSQVELKFVLIWALFLVTALTVPLFFIKQILRSLRMRLLATCILVLLAGTSLVWFFAPHYFAPATCALYALVLQGMRHMRLVRRRTSGVVLAWSVPIALVLCMPWAPPVRQLREYNPATSSVDWWTINRSFEQRFMVARAIRSVSDRNVVIVHYERWHNPHEEWVYNRADIDSAPIVWARDMGTEKNRALISYYKDRRIWLLEPDNPIPKLSEYKESSETAQDSAQKKTPGT